MKTLLDLKDPSEDLCPVLLSREFILQVLSKEKRKETIQKISDTFERISANYDIIIIEGQQRNQDMAVLGLCNPVLGKVLQAKSLIITNGEEYSLLDDIFLQKEYFSLNKAELADIRYNIKGFVVYREWATLTIRKMYKKTEDLLEKKDHLPLTMPSLIPESNFYLEAQHVEGFAPEVFWVTEAGSSGKLPERLALRPTSETALYKMYALWIRSYKDLPLKRYLSCQVWRYEGKMTRPFLRAREFHWIESHNVFASMEGAME